MTNESNARNLDQQIQVGKPRVLKGHTAYINSVFVKDNLIISGSGHRTIKIWDINSGTCLKKKNIKGSCRWCLVVIRKR